jgi:hypothetical protein
LPQARHAGRVSATPVRRLQPKRVPTSDQITRHDARALALIDYALTHGFTADLVKRISDALAAAGGAKGDDAHTA